MRKRKIFLGAFTLLALCTTACSFKFAGSSDSSIPALNSSSVTSSREDKTSSSSSLNQPSSSSVTSVPSSSSQEKSSSSSMTPSSSSSNSTSTSASSSRPSSSSAAPSSSSNKPSSSSSSKPSSSSSSNKPSSTSNPASSSSSHSSSSNPASSSSSHSSSSNPASSSSNPSSSSGSSSSSSQTKPDYVSFELFAFNDMHGNVTDTDGAGLGLAKTTSAIKEMSQGKNAICISQGDMWQGSVESNSTRGNLVTEWMNSLNFVSMTVGNHEYDWGNEYISQNSSIANFPTLGINVLYKANNQHVDYLQSSTTFTRAGVKFGVIGAIGDCLSSISYSKVRDVYFAKGSQLTNMVKAESIRLREQENCDFIIYSLHGNYYEWNRNTYSWETTSEYDISLSNDHYVDLVLEGHSHSDYCFADDAGIYHVQGGAYNKSIYRITLDMNFINNTCDVNPRHIDLSNSTSEYQFYPEDSETNAIFAKYYNYYSFAYNELGIVSSDKYGDELRYKAADLYLAEGVTKWGTSHPNIALGGGYMSVRSPGVLYAGSVTYKDIFSLFPFDNDILLCSIRGDEFSRTQYITGSSNYFMAWSTYGENIRYNLNYSETYYIVTDTYGYDYYKNDNYPSSYCNTLEIIDVLDSNGRYARDLLADYIAEGNWYVPPEPPAEQHEGTIDDPKTIAEGLEYAANFPANNVNDTESVGYYYIGVVSQLPDFMGGSGDLRNVHVKDADKDNDMTIYYLKKHEYTSTLGGNWDSLDDLSLGDVIVFWGRAFYYNSRILEFASGAYVVSINGVPTY